MRPVPVLLGLVRFGSGLGWVWFRISKNIWLWFGSGFCDYLSVWFCFVSTEPENHFSKILQLFSKNFFFKFLKSMKIQYKNTFNETKIRISQKLMFKNNNNIIFRQFENINILYFVIFKCLVLGLGCVEKSQFGLVWVLIFLIEFG